MLRFNKSSCAAIALLASTALAPAAFAQGANQPVQDCPGLQGYLDQNRATLSEDQIRQADEAVRGGQAEACVLIFTQFNQAGGQQAQGQQPGQQPGQPPAEGGAANIVVQQPAPTITVDQAQPQVSVQQAQPNVTVRQPQPEIIVRQPAPVVTIDIPQPEIIVRMPPPEVLVQQTPPQVQVQQAEPQVRVEQPEQPQVQVTESQQPQVQLTQPEGQANVQVEQTGQPNVTYERAEPQVNINQAEGQPTVTVEQSQAQPGQAGQQPPAGDQAARAAATQQLRDSEDPNRTPEAQEGAAAGQQPAAGQQQAAAQGQATAQLQAGAQGQMQTIALDDLEGMQVVNARGEQMGEVENLVMSTTDNKQYVVISHGGFLGLGEKRVALSLEGLTMQGDRIVVPGLTDEQIRALPEFQANEQAFPDVEDGAQLQIMSAQQ